MFMAMPDASGKLSSSVTSVADSFPIDVLPPILKHMVEEVAEVATVPHALPACEALGIVSAALGSGLAIPSDRERKTFGNLYLIPAAESGSGKSVTIKSMMAPVYEYQDKLRANVTEARYQLKAELLSLNGTLKAVKSDKQNMENDDLAKLIERIEYIETELERWPKIICEDVTQAKLQVLLASNRERIFSASADARQVIHAVLSGKGDNIYLKGWSGDSTDVDRISRSEVPLREPRISLLWCPQPDLLIEMFSRRILTDNGFLPRVLPCLVDTTPMLIDTKTRRVSDQTKTDWHALVDDLFTTYHANQGEPFVLKRSMKVQPVLIEYYNEIVNRRKNELADVGPYAARWAEQAWRLVVVLHAGTHGKEAHKTLVNSSTAEAAKLLMSFFSDQQLDLLRRTRVHAKNEAEKGVLGMLAVKDEITAREVQREHIVDSANEARALLEQMTADGKLTFRTLKPERGGHATCYYRRRDTCDSRDGRQNSSGGFGMGGD